MRENRPFGSSATTSATCTGAAFPRRGLVQPLLFIRRLGILGGIGAHPDDVMP